MHSNSLTKFYYNLTSYVCTFRFRIHHWFIVSLDTLLLLMHFITLNLRICRLVLRVVVKGRRRRRCCITDFV